MASQVQRKASQDQSLASQVRSSASYPLSSSIASSPESASAVPLVWGNKSKSALQQRPELVSGLSDASSLGALPRVEGSLPYGGPFFCHLHPSPSSWVAVQMETSLANRLVVDHCDSADAVAFDWGYAFSSASALEGASLSCSSSNLLSSLVAMAQKVQAKVEIQAH